VEVQAPFDPIAAAEAIVAGMPKPPAISHGFNRAAYSPSLDAVRMPSPERFTPREEYYSALFHELGHSTGHASRLARKGITDETMFGSHEYSQEELCAEITSAFLCGHAGIAPATLDNSAAYLAGWLSKLGDDQRLVVLAAAQAQRAADHILGVSHSQVAEEAA
jgi:antirestriction protein ArdC